MVALILGALVVFCIGLAVLVLIGPAIWAELRDLIHDFHWFGF